MRLEAGGLYEVAIQGAGSGTGTLADPLLRGIYTDDGGRPGGRLADSGDDDSGPRQDSLRLFRAPEDGIYHIAAGAGSAAVARTGTYAVSVRKIHQPGADAGSAGTIEVGAFVTGALDGGADEDWFAVELEQGVEYRIETRGNTDSAHGGTLYNPNLTVYDATREAQSTRQVAGDGSGKLGHNAHLEFTAYASGTCIYVGIGGGGRAGSYTLYVNRLTDEFGTTILTDGRVHGGRHRAPADHRTRSRPGLAGGGAYRRPWPTGWSLKGRPRARAP